MEKPSLDQLRIERTPEKQSSKAGKFLVYGFLLLLSGAAAGYYLWFLPTTVREVRTVATALREL